MEQGAGGRPETRLFVAGHCADRDATASNPELARSGATVIWSGYDVSGERPVGDQGLADPIPEGTDPHVDFEATEENPPYRQSGADGANSDLPSALVGGERQAASGLCVHTEQTGGCAPHQPVALRRHCESLGKDVGAQSAGLLQPFGAAQQTGAHVLGGRGYRPDLSTSGAQKHCQHHRVSGHYASQGRNGGFAAPDDAGGDQTWPGIGGLLRFCGKKHENRLAVRLVKSVWCQTLFCQESLTKNRNWVENKDNYLSSLKMKKLGQLAGVVSVMGALAAPLAAQENTSGVVLAAAEGTNTQVTDCVGFVREQRDLAQDTGIMMSRGEQRTLLNECRSGQLQERIAEQELILAALDEQIRQYDLRLDEQGRIIDANNQEIARIVAINGQLVIRIENTRADTAAKLAEAERILQELVAS